jgi:uncharacterized protein (UPF0548 family)
LPEVRSALAERYDVDLRSYPIGSGRAAFERARDALASWRHLDVPWLHFHGPPPVVAGQVVATVVSIAGLWLVNPCRVVYDELGIERDTAGFGYGTLPGHVESGEERFSVSFDGAARMTHAQGCVATPCEQIT